MTYDDLNTELEFGSKHLLIFGRAGAGKSHLIRRFLERTNRCVLATAPTGRAAMEIPRSVTNHNAFCLRPSVAFPWEPVLTRQTIEAIRLMDTWFLDEASMVREDIFNTIDSLLRRFRENPAPFGGVRFIGTGDLFQLPPVNTELEAPYVAAVTGGRRKESHNFLVSHSFARPEVFQNLAIYELRGSFRQEDQEIAFRRVLDRVRMGTMTKADIELLNTRVIRRNPGEIPILTATRKQRDVYNLLAVTALVGKHFSSAPEVNWHEGETPVRNLIDDEPAAQTIPIVVGMRVMFFRNHPFRIWLNGTTGTVTRIETSNGGIVARVEVLIDGQETPVSVEREDFRIYVPFYNSNEGKDCTKAVVTIMQFPFEPGYAATIHKSQGRTMESAIVDLGRGAFAPGQLYVALSRVKSFKGLHLATPIRMEDCIVSKTAQVFYTKAWSKIQVVVPATE